MKIITKTGNLMNVSAGHIIHGCNAQGVMGSGVALAVKNKYPHVFTNYLEIHADTGLKLGTAYPVPVSGDLILWNAITQQHFGTGIRQVSYDAIETCFRQINLTVISHADLIPDEIHIPAIGAGLGGGNWEIIREIIEQTITVPVTLWVFQ